MGRDFPPVQTGPGAHPTSCTMGTGTFPGVKCGRGMLTTHPLLVPRSLKVRAIRLPTSGPQPGLLRDHFTFLFLLDGGRVVNDTPRPLYLQGKNPKPTLKEDGWAPLPVWTGAENLAPTSVGSANPPADSGQN